MPRPTPLKKKNSAYSRAGLERWRCRQVQNRLPRKATVAAITVEMVFAASGGMPRPLDR